MTFSGACSKEHWPKCSRLCHLARNRKNVTTQLAAPKIAGDIQGVRPGGAGMALTAR
jgi:hypothetical protein